MRKTSRATCYIISALVYVLLNSVQLPHHSHTVLFLVFHGPSAILKWSLTRSDVLVIETVLINTVYGSGWKRVTYWVKCIRRFATDGTGSKSSPNTSLLFQAIQRLTRIQRSWIIISLREVM